MKREDIDKILDEYLSEYHSRIVKDYIQELEDRNNKAIEYINKLKPLTIEETSVKEELKSAYSEDNIRNLDIYFKTVCHLEDFEIGIWEIKDILQGSDKE